MPFNSKKTYKFNAVWNEVPCVYGVLDTQQRVVYVGQINNLKERHNAHCADTQHLMHRHKPTYMLVEVVKDEKARLVRERDLILEYDPPCNKV